MEEYNLSENGKLIIGNPTEINLFKDKILVRKGGVDYIVAQIDFGVFDLISIPPNNYYLSGFNRKSDLQMSYTEMINELISLSKDGWKILKIDSVSFS